MRIELKNSTVFRNEDIRDMFRRTLQAVGYWRKGRLPLQVAVTHARGSGVSGRASIGTNRFARGLWVKLCIPRVEKWTPDTFRSVVAVTIHECMHLVGSEHKHMTEAQLHCTLPLPPWAEGLQLRPKEKKSEPPLEQRLAASRANRLEHVERMLQKAELRSQQADRGLVVAKRWATRSTTLLKKWQRRKAAMLRAGAATHGAEGK